jgi:hypothetical protein
VLLRLVFGNTKGRDLFFLLDDFRSDSPEGLSGGFPWAPHRGIEQGLLKGLAVEERFVRRAKGVWTGFRLGEGNQHLGSSDRS